MDIMDCLVECCRNKELIKEWNRLTNHHLSEDRRAPIEKMIDDSTGYSKILEEEEGQAVKEFANFCFEFVFVPMLIQQANEALTLGGEDVVSSLRATKLNDSNYLP